MKHEIKPGYWKMRNGERAKVAGCNPGGRENRYWVGWSICGATLDWYKNGMEYAECESPYELIEPWIEPKEEGEPDAWLYVDISGSGNAGTIHSEGEYKKEIHAKFLKIKAYEVGE